jgi:hypothetical protein
MNGSCELPDFDLMDVDCVEARPGRCFFLRANFFSTEIVVQIPIAALYRHYFYLANSNSQRAQLKNLLYCSIGHTYPNWNTRTENHNNNI